jgi:predicted branched-subunit amino acid permease
LVGVAVKVTLVPAQIAPDGAAAMESDGVTFAFTTMFTALLVAVVGDEQARSLVITQVTTSPLLSVVVVKVLFVVFPPLLLPFTLHW